MQTSRVAAGWSRLVQIVTALAALALAVGTVQAQTSAPDAALLLPPAGGGGTGNWIFLGSAARGTHVQMFLVKAPAGDPVSKPGPIGAVMSPNDAFCWSQVIALQGPPGTYTFHTAAVDATGNVLATGSDINVTAPSAGQTDTTAPTILRGLRGDIDPARPNTYITEFIFGEPVTGVDAADFTFTLTGDAQAHIDSIQPDSTGCEYLVHVAFDGTSGSVQPHLNGGATAGIRDAAGNLYGGTASTAVFTLPNRSPGDGTAPKVTQASTSNAAQPTGPGMAYLTLRFSASVNVSATPSIPYTIGGVAHAAKYVGGTSTTDLVFSYDLDGTGAVAFGNTIQLNGGTIRDGSGLDAILTFTPPDTSAMVVDSTPPAPPVITAVDQTATPSIFGTAEPGTRVSVSISGVGAVGWTDVNLGSSGNQWRLDWYRTPLAAGSYSVTAYAQDAVGNNGRNSQPFTLVVPPSPEPGGRDITPPGVQGWKPGVLDPNHPNVVTFTVSFTEAVTGFDAADVQLDVTGDAHATAGAPQADASGATYVIPVTFSGTSGTIKVSIPGGTAADIRDLAGNLFGNGGDSYVTFDLPPPGAPVITSALSVDATVGQPFQYVVTASNAPTSYAALIANAWLTFDSATHTLSGTPTASTLASVGLSATNAAGTGKATLTIDVHATDGTSGAAQQQPPVVTDASVDGRVNVAITPVQVQATNGADHFQAPDLATYGLAISRSGLITGTPTLPADHVGIAVTADNTYGRAQPATITLTITADGASAGQGPTPTGNAPVLSDTSVTGTVGLTLKPVQIQATGSPTAFNAPGLAMYGLSIDHSGVISGIPTAAADNITVHVTGSSPMGSSAPAAIVLTIAPAHQTIDVAAAPAKVTATADQPLKLDATASSGLPVTYQVVSGPAQVVNNQVMFTGTGTVVIKAVQPGDAAYTATDATITLAAVPVDRLVNLSSRMHVDGAGASPAIMGFVVTGTTPRPMLLRAVGPSLSAFGVSDAAADPTLQLFDSAGHDVADNRGWNNDAAVAAAASGLGAFPLAPGSKDAALLVTLAPGAYTAEINSTGAGTVLLEVYDAGANAAVPTKQLVNLSARGAVDGAARPLVGGFAISGTASKRVLIRGVGPTLGSFGVADTLGDPVLDVYNAQGTVVGHNDDWDAPAAGSGADITAADDSSGAFALPPGSHDSALVLTLAPGMYSAVVSGAAGASGAAMVEIYELPDSP